MSGGAPNPLQGSGRALGSAGGCSSAPQQSWRPLRCTSCGSCPAQLATSWNSLDCNGIAKMSDMNRPKKKRRPQNSNPLELLRCALKICLKKLLFIIICLFSSDLFCNTAVRTIRYGERHGCCYAHAARPGPHAAQAAHPGLPSLPTLESS